MPIARIEGPVFPAGCFSFLKPGPRREWKTADLPRSRLLRQQLGMTDLNRAGFEIVHDVLEILRHPQ